LTSETERGPLVDTPLGNFVWLSSLRKEMKKMTPETFMFPNTSILPFETFRSFAPTFDRHWPFTWTPPCDIYETDKEIVLKMELP